MGWIVLALIAGAVLFAISIYNRLVAGRNRFKNAFAQIDVQLTRRHDLIPNLVETAKGYMKHERETLEGVINARNTAVAGLKAASKATQFASFCAIVWNMSQFGLAFPKLASYQPFLTFSSQALRLATASTSQMLKW